MSVSQVEFNQGQPITNMGEHEMPVQPLRSPDHDHNTFDVLLATSFVLIASVTRQDLRQWGGALQALTLVVNLSVLVWLDGSLQRWLQARWREVYGN